MFGDMFNSGRRNYVPKTSELVFKSETSETDDKVNIRLACIELAIRHADSFEKINDILSLAEKIYLFVTEQKENKN